MKSGRKIHAGLPFGPGLRRPGTPSIPGGATLIFENRAARNRRPSKPQPRVMRRLSLVIAAALACARPPRRARVAHHRTRWRRFPVPSTVSPHDSRMALGGLRYDGAYLTRDGGVDLAHLQSGRNRAVVRFRPPRRQGNLRQSQRRLPVAAMPGKPGTASSRATPQVSTGDDHASGSLRAAGQPVEAVTALAIDPADSRSIYLAPGSHPADFLRCRAPGTIHGPCRAWRSGSGSTHVPAGAHRSVYIAGADAL